MLTSADNYIDVTRKFELEYASTVWVLSLFLRMIILEERRTSGPIVSRNCTPTLSIVNRELKGLESVNVEEDPERDEEEAQEDKDPKHVLGVNDGSEGTAILLLESSLCIHKCQPMDHKLGWTTHDMIMKSVGI
jgi:hypothetical protein